MIIAECGINLVARSGTGNAIHVNYWIQNVFLSALIRPNCLECYTRDSSFCQ